MPQATVQPNPFRALRPDHVTPLAADERFGEAAHRWDAASRDALTLAVAARRPLLIRGEPGTGKSQIARAAAAEAGASLLMQVVHARLEATDLQYRIDHVARLADAQRGDSGSGKRDDDAYIERGVLWQAMESTDPLPVVLIDEIDKADADVPNTLLEVLGNRSFTVPALGNAPRRSIRAGAGCTPLVVITTNEERELPAAFVRRCIVLNVEVPKGAAFVPWLIARGGVHAHLRVDDDVRAEAARQVAADRMAASDQGYARVGLAEYVDLLAALHELTQEQRDDAERSQAQREWLARLGRYALRKYAVDGDAPSGTVG